MKGIYAKFQKVIITSENFSIKVGLYCIKIPKVSNPHWKRNIETKSIVKKVSNPKKLQSKYNDKLTTTKKTADDNSTLVVSDWPGIDFKEDKIYN